jgi:putative oxidoreductase
MRMQGLARWLFRPGGGSAPPATILIRLAVGGVFFASGLIKFLYANQGAGRFAKLGIPAPEFMANFVGVVEMAAGLLLAVGLATRLAAIPLVIDMLVAIGTSKLPMLFGPGPEPVAAAPKVGLWAFAYQARLDSTMLLGCLFLLAVGAGAWSLDAWLTASARKSSRGDDDSGDGELFEAVSAPTNGRSRSTPGRGRDRSAPLLSDFSNS